MDEQQRYNEQLAALKARDAKAKAADTDIGRYIRYPVADGYAYYLIEELVGRRARVKLVEIGDEYRAPVWGNGRWISLELAQRFLALRDEEDAAIDKADAWWTALKPGEVVHYHNGFNQWVRGIIVGHEDGEKAMLPTAMLGAWLSHDLPVRLDDGSAYLPTYPRRIKEGEKMRPHASNMLEYPEFGRDWQFKDPREMAPVSLAIPPMTPERHRLAKAAKTVQQSLSLIDRAMSSEAPPVSPERIAEIEAIPDEAIDTSEIPEATEAMMAMGRLRRTASKIARYEQALEAIKQLLK
jgi:hypothetical protein